MRLSLFLCFVLPCRRRRRRRRRLNAGAGAHRFFMLHRMITSD